MHCMQRGYARKQCTSYTFNPVLVSLLYDNITSKITTGKVRIPLRKISQLYHTAYTYCA